MNKSDKKHACIKTLFVAYMLVLLKMNWPAALNFPASVSI